MTCPRPNHPLTAEQRALCAKWLPLAVKLTLQSLNHRGFAHHEDEAEGLAGIAIVKAARVWEPTRGRFPWCLRLWVRQEVRIFACHGAQTVHRSQRAHGVGAYGVVSLDAKLLPDESDSSAFLDFLEAPRVDVAEALDAGRLMVRAKSEVARRLAGWKPTAAKRRVAKESVGLWVARTLEGATLESLAGPLGISRQAVDQRVARVQVVFERWAAEVRGEVRP
ncbi:hypothetical protein D7X74_30470 [Corallococcus sp. CA047B]|uniref:hypothetical protein n=1 Tax=Corallococcus sp. CA047B TaxID=2316729 RepID=UPI000EA2254A|nr:hypothetical protein [Corallococcus sp. CA047B]RKH09009.1 hypothetical protein D7X74_30470 [Corallococcus sp. CA047B]